MILRVIHSNSRQGNCYILEGESEILILECGVGINKIMKAINFQTGKVVGALCSHEHADHSLSIKPLLDKGINVFSGKGTFDKLGIKHHRAYPCEARKGFHVGSFMVYPFDINHDSPEPLCFLIDHPECGRILFITDTHYTEYQFPEVNHFLVEANYDLDIMESNLSAGKLPPFVGKRTLTSHMSIDTTLAFLASNDLTQAKNIVLVHLSPSNSNAQEFIYRVQGQTGKPTYVATPGLEIELL